MNEWIRIIDNKNQFSRIKLLTSSRISWQTIIVVLGLAYIRIHWTKSSTKSIENTQSVSKIISYVGNNKLRELSRSVQSKGTTFGGWREILSRSDELFSNLIWV